MNRIFSRVWSKALGQLVVASELAKVNGAVASGQGRVPGAQVSTLSAALAVALAMGGLGVSGTALAADAVCYDPLTGTPVGDASAAGDQVVCGQGAVAVGANALAVGVNANANGARAAALGFGSQALAADSVAVGGGTASERYSVAMGANALAEGEDAIGIGRFARSTSYRSVAVGADSLAAARWTTALGNYAQALEDQGTALGNSTVANLRATAVGAEAQALGVASIAIGGAQNQSVAIKATGEASIVIGTSMATASGKDAVAVGTSAKAQAKDALALGRGSNVTHAGSVALGAASVANGATLGNEAYSPTGDANDVAGIAPVGEVSIGSAGSERRITNLAAGANDTDAVNVSQLKAVAALASAGWTVTDADGNDANVGPGGAVTFRSGNSNILVTQAGVDDDGVVDITLNNELDLGDDGSITIGDTYIDNSSVTTSNLTVNGPDFTFVVNEEGAHYDGPITEGDHIVNKDYVDGAVESAKTRYYSVNDNGVVGGNYDNDGATGKNALAAGVGATASGVSATAMGHNASAAGPNSVAIGSGAAVVPGPGTGIGVVVIGNQAKVDGPNYGMAIGHNAYATGGTSGASTTTAPVAIGPNARAEAIGSTAVGAGARAGLLDSTVIGSRALAEGRATVAVGVRAQALHHNAIAIGNVAQATMEGSVALGGWAASTVYSGVALGFGSQADREAGMAGYDPVTGKASADTSLTWVASHGAVSVGGQHPLSSKGYVTRQIINVAAGTEDTDAVNVAQLKAVAAMASAGWTVTDADGNDANVGPGGTVTFQSGNSNILVTQAGVDDDGVVEITLSDDLDLTADGSVTIGDTLVNNDGVAVGPNVALGNTGLTVIGGTTTTVVDGDGLTSGTVVLSGVTNDVTGLSNTTLDAPDFATAGRAATEEQLSLVRDEIGEEIDANRTRYYSVNSTGGGNEDNDGATGEDAIAAGKDAEAEGDEAVALGVGASAVGDGAVAMGSGAQAIGLNSLALGAGATATHANSIALGAGSATTVGAQASYDGAYVGTSSSTGEVNVGGRQITGVAPGSAPTDAVNVSQLQGGVDYAIIESKNYTDTQIENVNNAITNLDNRVTAIEGDIIDIRGDITRIEGDIIDIRGDITDLGDRVTTIEGDVANLTVTVSSFDQRINAVSNGSDGMFQVSQEGPITKPQPTGTNSSAGGNGAVASGDNSLAVGNQAVASGDNSVALGQGAVASHDNSVALGQGSKTTVGAQTGYDAAYVGTSNSTGEVNVGGRTISGVAPGIAPDDAVNVSQLRAGVNYAIEQANAYTDSRFEQFYNDVWFANEELRQDMYSAVATALAAKQAPWVPGKTTYYAGLAGYKGQGAIGISLRRTADNGRWSLEGGFSKNRDGNGVFIGISGVLGD